MIGFVVPQDHSPQRSIYLKLTAGTPIFDYDKLAHRTQQA